MLYYSTKHSLKSDLIWQDLIGSRKVTQHVSSLAVCQPVVGLDQKLELKAHVCLLASAQEHHHNISSAEKEVYCLFDLNVRTEYASEYASVIISD